MLSWYLFDWATQPFFTLIVTFLYGPYFAARIASSGVEGQALWGYAGAAAGLVIALAAPLAGAIADRSGRRKPWIMVFSVLFVAGCSALAWGRPGIEASAVIILAGYVAATVGAELATVFTNAMMPDLARGGRLGRLSGTGAAVGYLGGLVSLLLALALIEAADPTGGKRFVVAPMLDLLPAGDPNTAIGPFAALWYVLFVWPLFAFVPDRPKRAPLSDALHEGLAVLGHTLRVAARYRRPFLYLVGNVFIRDGMVALGSFGGIYAVGVLGWGTTELGAFGILSMVGAGLGAFLGGRLDDRIGPLAVLIGALVGLVLVGVTMLSLARDSILFVVPVAPAPPDTSAFAATPSLVMLACGALIGLCFGPLNAAGRSLLVRLSPPDKITEFFGLYAFSGKATSFLAPLSVAVLTDALASQRGGAAVIPLFFIIGIVFLLLVRREGCKLTLRT